MKKKVPNDNKIQTILDLICALDGRVLKVVNDNGLLTVYADVSHYDEYDAGDENEYLFDDSEDIDSAETVFEGDEYDEDEYDDDNTVDCYYSCDSYKPVSEADWRCIHYCTCCGACLLKKA